MSFQQTAAASSFDLLGKLRDFAALDGWTINYDDAAGLGRLQLSKGVCKVAIEIQNFVRNDSVFGGTHNDSYFRAALCEAFVGGNTRYYGHTGSIVTANGDGDTVDTNDLYGPFSNVWFFSNAAKTHIHMVAQGAPERYSHFSFGILDDLGLTQDDVAYCVGVAWTWWPDSADYTNASGGSCAFNWPQSSEHRSGFIGSDLNIRIPDGLLDPALEFTDGVIFTRQVAGTHTRGDFSGDGSVDGQGLWLDYFLAIQNDTTTGGVPLGAYPVFYNPANMTYLGQYPDVRQCSVGNLSPAQEITLGPDTWMVFPLKRKGSRDDTNYGVSPQPVVNSIEYGLAYKKVV